MTCTSPMSLETARELVIAICDRKFVTMDLPATMASLEGVTLAAMLEAKRMVENANAAARAAAQINGGAYSQTLVPDDRLLAAVYVLENYPADVEPILAVPTARPEGLRSLAVIQYCARSSDAETETSKC